MSVIPSGRGGRRIVEVGDIKWLLALEKQCGTHFIDSTLRMEEGCRQQNVGSIWKLERQENQLSLGRPRTNSCADSLVLASCDLLKLHLWNPGLQGKEQGPANTCVLQQLRMSAPAGWDQQ